MTHVLGHGLAWGLHMMRRDIGRLTWGYFTHSKRIGLNIVFDDEATANPVPITIWDAHNLSLLEFAKICSEKVNRAQNK